jgi:signal transduction histidine kinase
VLRMARRVVLDYGAALFVVSAALAATWLLPALNKNPTPLFFGAVMASAWHGGLGPGMVATLASALILDFFFLAPVQSFEFGFVEGIRLLIFLLVAGLIISLNAARRRLAEALRLQSLKKDQFLAVLAQELNAPLRNILGSLAALREANERRQTSARTLDFMERQAQVVSRLVDDLYDLGALGSAQVRLLKTPVNLAVLFNHAAETGRACLGERDHKLIIQLPEQPVVFPGDAMRLEQVLVKLLCNAARYTNPGGTIVLQGEQQGRDIVICVTDNGLGFDSAHMPHIFDLARQDGAEPAIGLNLVRALVEMHGGTVTAQSDGLQKGSKFTVRLPISITNL